METAVETATKLALLVGLLVIAAVAGWGIGHLAGPALAAPVAPLSVHGDTSSALHEWSSP